MYCPVCATPLHAVERLEISMDFCPTCGGIWLDQGELDELVRREAAAAIEVGLAKLSQARRSRAYDRVDFDAPPPAAPLSQLDSVEVPR